MKANKGKPYTINIITLGCSKNVVDSEYLASQVIANNIRVVYDADNSKARTVIINTCGFIQDAKQESIDTILQYVKAKEKGLLDHVYVMGCLSERYKEDLRSEISQVDQYFGVNDIPAMVNALGFDYKKELLGERQISTPSHYAWLKVSEGCDRTCAFCAIPLIRGKHISVPMDQLEIEAEFLANKGVKELILIAQDLSYYGRDLYNQPALAGLLEKLAKISKLEWIRLHYAYPAGFPEDIIQVVKDHPTICKYLDIPFQHISNTMLKRMRRGNNKEETYTLIHKLRGDIPGIALRTTLLVGHPGETDKDFEELIEFVKQCRFDRLGIFTYSHEEETYNWKHDKDNVPENTKTERASILMELQQDISNELNINKIGKVFKVIVDRVEGDQAIGRTEFDSPEVDNEVIIQNEDKKIRPGEFIQVRVTGAEAFDLFGELV